MPAKLQTEYMRNFKWTDRPIRFKQPVASLDPKTSVCQPRRAGLTSTTIGIHREPTIQVKMRSASPVEPLLQSSGSEGRNHRSSSHHHHRHLNSSSKQGLSLSASGSALPFSDPLYRPVPPLINSARSDDALPAGKPTWKRPGEPIVEDFILLGSQQKFAPNVAYRLRKPLDPSRLSQLPPRPPTAERVEQDTQTADVLTLPPAPQFVQVSSPPVARFYTSDENVQVNEVELPKDALTPPPSPPNAPRREKTPEAQAAVQTEGVQTEVDDHYAVRHRLGIVSRANGARFQTEYGRQFNPVHTVSAPSFRRMKQEKADSPLMNAEQMFHRSRSRSPVGAAGVMPQVLLQTEYGRSFKPYQWQLHQQQVRRSLSADGHEILYEGQVPRQSPIPTSTEPDEKHHHHHHHDPEVVAKVKNVNMKWPKRFISEYMSNFRQPSAFRYEDGTWKGVVQPHVGLAQSAPTAVVAGDPSWVAEVRELKSRAKEYQLRNKGTHFSSTHVGQLYSEKARLWDSGNEQIGDGGSRLAMLDVPVPQASTGLLQEARPEVAGEYVQVDTLPTPEDLIRPAGLATIRRGNVRESLEWAVQSIESSSSANSESECSSSVEEQAPPQPQHAPRPETRVVQQPQPIVNRLEIPPKTGRSESSTSTRSSSSSSNSGVLPTAAGGRVRTSRLAELQALGNGSPRRHHLDVTTPAVGGAILTSPPIRPLSGSGKHHKKSRSGSRNRDGSVPNTGAGGVSSGYSSGTTSGRARSPAASGKPTSDTHMIVDRDKPIRFQYVPTPNDKLPATNTSDSRAAPGTIEQLILERSRENAPIITAGIAKSSKKPSEPLSTKQQNSKASMRSAGVMASIPEPMSTTYKVGKKYPNTVKPPTVASQKTVQQEQPASRASSATYSAASDVLEKARSRANFWDKSATFKAN